MKVLFVYYVPSGGVDTLNRQRCRLLRQFGVHAECLYYGWGAGLQNPADFPVHVTKNDIAIKHILDSGNYDAIVVTTDHKSLQRLRLLGFGGKLILEIQGYGPKEVARQQLTDAMPVINAHASALLNPQTPHISALFQELYPHIPRFQFNNCFDAAQFTYRPGPKPGAPVIAWLGRIEDNKNWREFLHIGHQLSKVYGDLQMWMFEDPNLAIPAEREQFVQLVDSLGLSQRLTIRTNVPHAEMQYYFSRVGDSGGFLCSTSKVEGAPYAVLEAMSCRCPVLSTNSDGVSTSIYHNQTGKFYRLGDIAHAVREARELMEDMLLRERIRAGAEQHVRQGFAPAAYGSHFLGMLQTI
ncbi:glycosyltransferase family 1 protein [Paenibacillus sambharensis]|uniref:Glycosyltransferase family 1 protein n=1 Tax=Paenibacillus sambharensis TaxID=1803190 RepID=A0A2W1LDY3_9BACL|nr:glycosyltransferase family 4 protein [Paenibacillus sambharensis]PZD93272.1 glycosyltransferase family 1 protein [Paenibacillus sambharensis]